MPFIKKFVLGLLILISISTLVVGGILQKFPHHRIFWITAAQSNLAGFNIYRSESKTGPFQLINPAIIPIEGDRYSGHRYEFEDRNVGSAKIVYYWIEVLRLDGTSEKLDLIEVKSSATGIVLIAVGIVLFFLVGLEINGIKRRRNKNHGGV
jgi:hypothetical protein